MDRRKFRFCRRMRLRRMSVLRVPWGHRLRRRHAFFSEEPIRSPEPAQKALGKFPCNKIADFVKSHLNDGFDCGGAKTGEGVGGWGQGVGKNKKPGSCLPPTPNLLHPFRSCIAADGIFRRPSKKPGLPLQGIPGSYEKIAPGNSEALKLSSSDMLWFDGKLLSDPAFPAQR
jgi:hypothetical protein